MSQHTEYRPVTVLALLHFFKVDFAQLFLKVDFLKVDFLKVDFLKVDNLQVLQVPIFKRTAGKRSLNNKGNALLL